MFYRNVQIALGSSAALLLLAACSGGGSATSNAASSLIPQTQQARQAASGLKILGPDNGRWGLPPDFRGLRPALKPHSPGWLSAYAKSKNAKIYVSDGAFNTVGIYNATTTALVGTITDGLNVPLGSFTDTAGNLYVANLGSSTVTVYPLGQTSPSKTYSTGLSNPIGVAVGKDGTLYVSEFSTNAVVEYDPGQTSPSRTISINEAEGVALDSKNNLYVSYNNANTGLGGVEVFAPKSTSGTDLGISVEFTGDLKLDRKDNIVLEDQIAETVNLYKAGTTTPYGTISVGGDAYKVALNKEQCRVYVANAASNVDIFLYKPNGALAQSIAGLGDASGVSLTPAPPFDD